MEITLFYTKEQRDKLWEAGLRPEMVYFLRGELIAEEEWKKVDKKKLEESFPGLIDILKEIGETKQIIDPIVDEYVNKIDSLKVKKIVEYVTKSPSWRERPLIMRLAAKALGSEFTEALIHAASGIELFEESAILLDDILDEAEMCVGKETAWRKYGINETFIAHSILTLLARSAILESCRKSNLDIAKTREIISAFEEIYYGDYVGQYMDVEAEKRLDFSEKDYFEMISKTPGSQFANALAITCILAGKENFKKELKEFGRLFGIAAQLRDDIIDIIGNEEVVYKKLLTDILRKKKRLPLILLLQRNESLRDLFFNSSVLEETQFSEILFELRKNNIIEECISRVKKLVQKAIVHLEKLDNNPGKRLLKSLVLLLANFGG